MFDRFVSCWELVSFSSINTYCMSSSISIFDAVMNFITFSLISWAHPKWKSNHTVIISSGVVTLDSGLLDEFTSWVYRPIFPWTVVTFSLDDSFLCSFIVLALESYTINSRVISEGSSCSNIFFILYWGNGHPLVFWAHSPCVPVFTISLGNFYLLLDIPRITLTELKLQSLDTFVIIIPSIWWFGDWETTCISTSFTWSSPSSPNAIIHIWIFPDQSLWAHTFTIRASLCVQVS